MILRAIMREIEGDSFAARVSIASDAETFIEALESESAMVRLFGLMDAEANERILLRVQSLAQERSDVRYRNPRDVAIAAYTFVLGKSDEAIGNVAAIIVQTSAQRCWWAVKIARLVSEGYVAHDQVSSIITLSPLMINASSASSTSGNNENQILILSTGLDSLSSGRLITAPAVVTSSDATATRYPWHSGWQLELTSPSTTTTTNTGTACHD